MLVLLDKKHNLKSQAFLHNWNGYTHSKIYCIYKCAQNWTQCPGEITLLPYHARAVMSKTNFLLNLPISQWVPSHPFWHTHTYPSCSLTHWPSLRHGEELQTSSTWSQVSPVNPSVQKQVNEAVSPTLLLKQTPLFMQGELSHGVISEMQKGRNWQYELCTI